MDDSSPPSRASAAPQLRFGKIDDLVSRVSAALDGARKRLFTSRSEEGYWCGELGADSTLESDYILLHTLLGTGEPERMQKAANYILRQQNEDGGWSIFTGGPSNISASVKAYFGLKLAGYGADHPALARARETILELGGVAKVNTFTKIYLCFFGQYDYDAVPAIPPCSFPSGSGSTSTKFPHGRGRFWCRCPSHTPRNPLRRFPKKWVSRSFLSAAAIGRRCICLGRTSWSHGATSF
jgi:hypothetical protein